MRHFILFLLFIKPFECQKFGTYTKSIQFGEYITEAVKNTKFTKDQENAADSVFAAIDSASCTFSYIAALNSTDEYKCKSAIQNYLNETIKVSIQTFLYDSYFLYAFRFIEPSTFDSTIQAISKCLPSSKLTQQLIDSKSLLKFSWVKEYFNFDKMCYEYNDQNVGEASVIVGDKNYFNCRKLQVVETMCEFLFQEIKFGFDKKLAKDLKFLDKDIDTATLLQKFITKNFRKFMLDQTNYSKSIIQNIDQISKIFKFSEKKQVLYKKYIKNLYQNLKTFKYKIEFDRKFHYNEGLIFPAYRAIINSNKEKFSNPKAARALKSVDVANEITKNVVKSYITQTEENFKILVGKFQEKYGLDIELTYTTLADLNFFYAFNYVDNVIYDKYLDCLKAVLDEIDELKNNNKDQIQNLKMQLDQGKAALIRYNSQIDLDYSSFVYYFNQSPTIPLSTLESKSIFTVRKLYLAIIASQTLFKNIPQENLYEIATNFGVNVYQFNIENDSNFTNFEEFMFDLSVQLRLYALGKVNTFRFMNIENFSALKLSKDSSNYWSQYLTQLKQTMDREMRILDRAEVEYKLADMPTMKKLNQSWFNNNFRAFVNSQFVTGYVRVLDWIV